MLRSFAVVSLALVVTGSAMAQTKAPDPEARPEQVRPATGDPITDDFIAGFNGDAEAMQRAMTAAKRRLAERPDSPVLMAWLGAATAFSSGEAFQRGDAAEGIRRWTSGNSQMNQAVELAPDNPGVRLIRGKSLLESTYYDPNPQSVAASLSTATSDLEHALAIVETDPDVKARQSTRADLYGWLAQAYHRAGRKDDAERMAKIARELGFKEPVAKTVKKPDPVPNQVLNNALVILTDDPAPLVADHLKAGVRDPARYEAAIALLDKRLETSADDARSLAWRGFTRTLASGRHFAAGKVADGMKLWQAGADEIDRAEAMADSGLHPLVLRALTRLESARHSPDPAEARLSADRAAADFDRAWRMLPDLPAADAPDAKPDPSEIARRREILLLNADALWRAGKPKLAARALDRAAALDNSASTKERIDRLRKQMAEAGAAPAPGR